MDIKIKGLNKARERWKRYGDMFSGRNDVLFRKAGEIVSVSVSRNFEAKGRPKWPKRTYKYAWPILWKTGRMRARSERTALTWEHQGRRHINNVYAPEYGKYHQYANIHAPERLPVRKFVWLVDRERQELVKLFRNAFIKG
jgi:phage gpG-like protein